MGHETSSRTPLTRRQAQILNAITTTVEDRGYPPSLRELGGMVGLTSPSSVIHQLNALAARGYIQRDERRPRALRVIPEQRTVSGCDDVTVRTHVPVMIDGRPVLVPIADATRVMRAIAKAVWPDEPSPMEETAFADGMEFAERVAVSALAGAEC